MTHENKSKPAKEGMTTSVVVGLIILSLVVGGIIGYVYNSNSGNGGKQIYTNNTTAFSPNMAKLNDVAGLLTQYLELQYGSIPPLKVMNATPAIRVGMVSGNHTLYTYVSGDYQMIGEEFTSASALKKVIEDKKNNNSSGSQKGQTAAQTDYPNMTKDLSNSSLYPSLGPENATHTVVEFADFRCVYCGMAAGLANWTDEFKTNPQYSDFAGIAENIQKMAQEGKVRFIFVPSLGTGGPESQYALEASLCANEQGKFWKMHDLLFSVNTKNEDPTPFSKANIEKLAMNVDGLNTTQFNTCLDNDETHSMTMTAVSALSKYGGRGTPAFYVDGKKVKSSWSGISSMISK